MWAAAAVIAVESAMSSVVGHGARDERGRRPNPRQRPGVLRRPSGGVRRGVFPGQEGCLIDCVRRCRDALFVCCDGLVGLPESITAVWSQAIVQTCVVHLVRASMRYASNADRRAIAQALRPICTAPAEAAALGPRRVPDAMEG